MGRWVRFVLIIILGAAAGLFYGWVVNPVTYVDTTPDSLRIDYQTDYVLMVAEAFHNENDLPTALQRLALLGDSPAAEIIHQAILFAEKQGYVDSDITLMQHLETAVTGIER